MNALFSIKNIAFTVLNYPVSIIELIGLVFSFVSVWQAARANRLMWYTGLVGQIAYFALFYQIQLYSDMLLQVFFTVLGFYGMFTWRETENTATTNLNIRYMSSEQRIIGLMGIIFASILWGFLMSKLPVLLPQYFTQPTAAPYLDGAIGVMSVFATFYQTRKFIEFWWLYIVVDVLATGLYFYKGIPFSGVLYALFLVMAVLGARHWRRVFLEKYEVVSASPFGF
jgi:nicotinamide mononucleotide transporter